MSVCFNNAPTGLTYIVTSYTGTNYGATYSESYSPAGNFTGSDLGFFGLASQRAGGNAPTNLFNRSLSFESVGSRFKLSLGTNTFAQYSATPAYGSGVGSYVYSRASTNNGNLTLNYLAPSDVSGGTNAAKLMFFAHNLAVFTNADRTVGAAVLGNAANLAPATLADKTVYATNNVTGNLNQLSFAADNTFSITGYLNDTGTYTFSTYSPESGLAQLTFTGGDLAGDTGSLQLDYATASSGRYLLSIFDSGNNLVGTSRGNFGQP